MKVRVATKFTVSNIKRFLAKPDFLQGQVLIIGGSSLFHGAPLLAIKVASRFNRMVFFASPEPRMSLVAAKLKSQYASFIWIPFSQINDYLMKVDSILIGPGLMRFRKERERNKFLKKRSGDAAGKKTKRLTERLLKRFPQKQWIIDAGSLQVVERRFIPSRAILTPNHQEMKFLFGQDLYHHPLAYQEKMLKRWARETGSIILTKEPQSLVCSSQKCFLVAGGNEGLDKGGTGDVLAGLIASLSAQKNPLLAASTGVWLAKKAADELYKRAGPFYSADDLAQEIPVVARQFLK